jgi:membrane associated rhomboid family serine protease
MPFNSISSYLSATNLSKSLMSQFQFRRFEVLPPVIKNLIIINVLVWLAQLSFGEQFTRLFALHFYKSEYFKPWQVITHMFMHSPGGLGHLFFNMLSLWMFGNVLENIWGPKRFITFYMLCGLMAAVAHLGVMGWQAHQLELTGLRNLTIKQQVQYAEIYYGITMGASGAVYGIMAAFGYLFPNTLIYIYFLVPVKAKYLMAGLILLEFILGRANLAGDNAAHFAHLGGALMGLLIVFYWRKNRRQFY